MGRRGPLPDPNKPTRRDLAPVVQLNASKLVAPDPPKGLLPANRRRWKAYFESDVARAITEIDVPAVTRLFRYYDAWDRAAALGDLAVMVKLERPIAALEGQLAATPASRARLGIQLGQAKRLTVAAIREELRG